MTPPTPNDMPGAPATPTEPPAAPPQPTPPVATEPPAAPAQPDAPTPPWEKSGEPFDPERAWNLIQNQRNELADFKKTAQPILDEHERLRRESQGELDTALEDLANAHRAFETWRNRAVTAEAKVLAADTFIDADTVLALVGDLSGFVDDDGGIDTPQLQQRLDQLAADKPFLVKAQQPQGFTPNRGQGQSGTGQLPLDAQIKAAQDSGNLLQSIALKQQKLQKH